MIKIIEVYSDKIIADVKITSTILEIGSDRNGLIMLTPTDTVKEFKIQTSQHQSLLARERAVISAKLAAINKIENDKVLIIVRNGDRNLASTYRHLDGNQPKLKEVSVNKIPFYKAKREVNIDKKILDKMNMIYNVVSAVDFTDTQILIKTVDSIIKCYKDTGVITKNDLTWLNSVYNKYKSSGVVYEGELYE